MTKTYYLLITLIVCGFHFTSAQPVKEMGNPFIHNFSPSEYKGGAQNWSFEQDNCGRIFVGNNSGILVYDGLNWHLERISNHSVVYSLAKDSLGTIYAGAAGDFGYMAVNSAGRIRYQSLIPKLSEENKKSFTIIWYTVASPDGIYFISKEKIFRYHNDSVYVIDFDKEKAFGFYVNKRVLITDLTTGIYEAKGNKLKKIPYSDNLNAKFILPYNDKFLIQGARYNYYILDINKLENELNTNDTSMSQEEFRKTYIRNISNDATNYLKNNMGYGQILLSNGNFAFATLAGGVMITDKNLNILNIINKNRGLKDNTVINVFEDKSNNLWAGLNNGIAHIEANSPFTVFDDRNNLEGVVISTCRFNGRIYAGTFNGLYYLENYKCNYKNDHLLFKKFDDINGDCWTFQIYNDILLAGTPKGVCQIEDTSVSFIAYNGKPYDIEPSTKFENTLFVGLTDGFGFVEVKQNGKKLEAVKSERFPEITEAIRVVINDKDGNLWLTSEFNGLLHIKFNDKISDYTISRYDTTNGLKSLEYNYLRNYNNQLYVCSPSGLFDFIKTENNDYHFKQNNAFNFVKDKKIGFSQILNISADTTFINADFIDGYVIETEDTTKVIDIPFNEINPFYINYYLDNNLFWISTNEGLFRFDRYKTKKYNEKYNTLISNVSITDDSTIFYGFNYLKKSQKDSLFTIISPNQPDLLEAKLEYKNNNINVEFSSAFYEHEQKIEYSYFLEGFDDEWSDWSTKTSKEYTNLPEGDYTFHVKSRNIYKIEATESAYSFTILPPWYRTIWAYISYFIVLILTFYIFLRILTSRLKKANQKLERIVSDRTKEISLKNTELEQQKEEIEAQRDQLEEVNIELEKLSIVASETDNSVVITDEKGNIEWVNEGFTKLFGYTMSEFIYERGNNILKTSTNPEIGKAVTKCFTEKIPVIYSTKSITKSGNKVWTQTTLSPIIDMNNNITKLIAIDSNITKIKKTEQELATKNRMITDSINYAKLIQEAILPVKNDIKKEFSDHFVFFKPRDIVSGDFYWFTRKENKILFAVADCTGHGVPGAFMSMIGNTMLNEIINGKNIVSPAEILDNLNTGIVEALNQNNEMGNANDDGMDISVCCYDRESNQLCIAIANHFAYLVNDENQITTIKGDVYSVGGMLSASQKTEFTNHCFEINSKTRLYMFSDGYQDQFGGPENTKFMPSRFKNLILTMQDKSMTEQGKIIDSTFNNWINHVPSNKTNHKQIDDVLVVGLEMNA